MNCLNCIKSISGTKSSSGLSVTVVGVFNDGDNIVQDHLNFAGYHLKLKSINKVSHLLYSATYSIDFGEKIKGSAIFKTIPKNVYDAFKKYDQLSKLLADFSPYTRPSKIFLKVAENEDDIYVQKTGFTPDEIFKIFDLTVYYPPILHYKITELYIKNNISVTSLIQSIFPIQGLSINYLSDKIINVELSPNFTLNFLVQESSISYESKPIDVLVTGIQSEPKNIIFEGEQEQTITVLDDNYNTVELTVTKNIFNKIYSINQEKITTEKISIPSLHYLEENT